METGTADRAALITGAGQQFCFQFAVRREYGGLEVFAVYGQGVCLNAGNVFAVIQKQTVAAILVAAAVCELSYLAVLLRCELWEGAVNSFNIGRLHCVSSGSFAIWV